MDQLAKEQEIAAAKANEVEGNTTRLKRAESVGQIPNDFDLHCEGLGLNEVTAAQAEAWGKAWEQKVAEKDVEAAKSMLLFDPMHQWVIRNIPLKYLDDFDNVIENYANDSMSSLCADHCSLIFTKIFDDNGSPRPVFRFINSEGGVSYHYHFLRKTTKDQVVSVDHFSIVTGERQSDAMRRGAVNRIPETDQDVLAQFSAEDILFAQHGKQWDTFVKYLTIDGLEAIDFYEQLSDELKANSVVRLNYVVAINKLGTPEQKQTVLSRFADEFGGLPFADHFLLDFYLKNERFDDFRKAYQNVTRIVGTDLNIATFEARLQHQRGDTPKAQQTIQTARDQEPDSSVKIDLSLSAYLAIEDFKGVLENLKLIVDKSPNSTIQLDGVPAFYDFTESPEYEEFVKYRNAANRR